MYRYSLFAPLNCKLWSALWLSMEVISSTRCFYLPPTLHIWTYSSFPWGSFPSFSSTASWCLGRLEKSPTVLLSMAAHPHSLGVFFQTVLKWSSVAWVKKKFPLEKLIIACRYFFVWSRRGQFNRLCNTTKNKIALKEVSCWVTTLLPEPIRSQ